MNELNGREFGDDVLRIIGNEIRAFLAETEGIASRIEGDRFDIFCKHQEDYQAVLDRFQAKVDSISNNVSISLRMGVKPWAEGIEPVALFDYANAACSMMRGNYISHLKIYDEKMLMRELLNQRLLNDLRQAVEERQFTVYYQPKYNIQCDPPRLTSAEALIRWQHPELGLIPPNDFIPLFEGNGQISIVDKYVWAETARQIAAWKDKYGVVLPVSVNLSRVDVFDPALESALDRLLAYNGLGRGTLKLEVTESAYTGNADQVIKVVESLRRKGYVVEMDDFGSGYSSLNMLSAMPVDVLKMDRAFIRRIGDGNKDTDLVALTLGIAKSRKIPVVAEGVETEEQLELLRKLGCPLVQGFYFSRPLPAQEFEDTIIRKTQEDGNETGEGD